LFIGDNIKELWSFWIQYDIPGIKHTILWTQGVGILVLYCTVYFYFLLYQSICCGFWRNVNHRWCSGRRPITVQSNLFTYPECDQYIVGRKYYFQWLLKWNKYLDSMEYKFWYKYLKKTYTNRISKIKKTINFEFVEIMSNTNLLRMTL